MEADEADEADEKSQGEEESHSGVSDRNEGSNDDCTEKFESATLDESGDANSEDSEHSHRGALDESMLITDLDAGESKMLTPEDVDKLFTEIPYDTFGARTRLITIAEEENDDGEELKHTMTGVLWKRGHRFLRGWNARFFVYDAYEDPPLKYYDSEHHAKKQVP